MKKILLASSATILLALAGCASTSTDDSSTTSESPSASASASASTSPTSASPSATRTSASPAPTTNASAAGVAQSLTCADIVVVDPPRGASPEPSSAARCNLGAQGYIVQAYSTQSAATSGLNQLRDQASSTGETMILAAGTTWIVRPAEGTAVGKDMLTAAKAIGGKKKTLS